MGRNAQRRKQIKDALDDLAGQGLELGRVAKAVAADGYQGIELAVVDVGSDAEGYVVTCDECGRQGRIPSKPERTPDMIKCPDCMRARIARG